MKIIIKDVGYNRGYVIGPYLQERPGVNADVIVEEGEDQEECALKALRYLKSITDRFHKEDNPHLHQEEYKPIYLGGTIESPVINIQDERMEMELDNCDTLDKLRIWKELNPIIHARIVAYYNARLKQLTQS